MTAHVCLRCGNAAQFVDDIGTLFCAPCARLQEVAIPDLAVRPIEDTEQPCCDMPSAAPCDQDDCPGTRKEAHDGDA